MESLIGTVPDSWGRSSLGEICDVLAGPSSARFREAQPSGSEVPIVAPRDIRFNRIFREAGSAVSRKTAEELARYRLSEGDIVCSRSGELGRSGLVCRGQEGWLLGTACLRIRPPDLLFGRYMAYYLNHANVRDWIMRNAGSTAIPSISTQIMVSMPVVVPSKGEQHAIADSLSVLDDKIALHYQISKKTAEIRDMLLPVILADPLRRRLNGPA